MAVAAVSDDSQPGQDEAGMAVIFESLFRRRDLTLADPATAAAWRASLEAFLVLLESAAQGGVITRDQFGKLGAALGAADRAPDNI